MKKHTQRALILCLLVLVFNLLFFVLGGARHPLSVWIAYAFIHLGFLVMILTPFLLPAPESNAIRGVSPVTVSNLYFAAELLVGLIVVFSAPAKLKASLLVQTILFILYAAVLIPTLSADKKRVVENGFIEAAAASLKLSEKKLGDPKLGAEVEQVYSMLHASPVRSCEAAAGPEAEIKAKVFELSQAVDQGALDAVRPLCARLQELIRERNSAIKTGR